MWRTSRGPIDSGMVLAMQDRLDEVHRAKVAVLPVGTSGTDRRLRWCVSAVDTRVATRRNA